MTVAVKVPDASIAQSVWTRNERKYQGTYVTRPAQYEYSPHLTSPC
jgi:hypothetical protein